MGMSKETTSLWLLLLARKTFLSVVESWSNTYVTDALESVIDCYPGKVQYDVHIELLVVPIETYKDCGEVKVGRVVLRVM